MRMLVIVAFMLIVITGAISGDELEAGEPLQLLDYNYDSDNNMTVSLKAESVEKLFLNSIVANREVVIVSIAGAFRKGKSFMLNYMLRYLYANYKSVSQPEKAINESEAANWLGSPDKPLSGFAWKSGTKRETTGIIFWSDIFLYDAPSGEKIAIYLMDTQGLFDHHSSPTDNIRIFSLSALISTVQLMNIYSMIEEDNLEYLQFATEVARFTAVESNSETKPFQKLMFLIRDWNNPDEYAYGLEGGKIFIDMYLKIKNFHTAGLKQVREYMRKTFEEISCFLMPYPGKVAARSKTFDGRWSEIDEDFVEELKKLIPILFAPENLTSKTINGQRIKAFELSVYIKQYVDLFKSENLPEAKSIYESTLENQFEILMSKAVDVYLNTIAAYQDNIKSKLDVEELHKVGVALALRFFNEEKKFGNDDESQVYQKELEEKLKKAFAEWKAVKLEFFDKIEVEQAKTYVQAKLVSEAKDDKLLAQQEAKLADENYVELKRQIEEIKYDTAESRREVEALKRELVRKEKERQEALLKQQQAEQYYEEMKRKADFLERQLALEKAKSAQKVQEKVGKVRQESGISKWFGFFVIGIFKSLGLINEDKIKMKNV